MTNQTPGALPTNDAFNILTVFNPSSLPFEIWYNGELHKTIEPNKAAQVVKMVAGDANHGSIKHLIDRMCRLNKVSKNDEVVRMEWYDVIVRNQVVNAIPAAPTVEQTVLNINKSLDNPEPKNPDWKFDPLTGAPIIDKTPVITPDQVDTSNIEIQPETAGTGMAGGITPPPPPHPDGETNSILTSMRNGGEARVMSEQVMIEEAPKVPEKRTEKPTREQLMTFAGTIMAINDPQTKAKLDAMTDEQLAAELRYEEVAGE